MKPSGQPQDYHKGRGAQFNTANRFLRQQQVQEHLEGIDDWTSPNLDTVYYEDHARQLVNKVESPDVGMMYSMNPYQGCEHGCIYCYARNSFEYRGWSAGIDFERRIVVKKNAAELLRKFLMHPKWQCVPIGLSGNTDCYQPAERKFGITRQQLEVCNQFNQPVGIISKNAGMLRDLDLLQEMGQKRIVSVLVTITSLNETLRRVMEPRTTTGLQRLRLVERLAKQGIHTGVMMGPVIPGLNDQEMHQILKSAGNAGARFSAYTFIRLNGAIQFLFHDWLYKNFPHRADKVWHMIEESHGGKVSDSRFGVRMRGEGSYAAIIHQQYKQFTQKFGLNDARLELDCSQFRRPGEQGRLF